MEQFYRDIIASGTITPSDPKTRKPLVEANRGAGMRASTDKEHTCALCKWSTPDDVTENEGKCVALKNKLGAIWQRTIRDYNNTVCDHFEGGERDFRELV